MPKTELLRLKRFGFHHQESGIIWQNRLFENTYEAQVALNEFFGFKKSYQGVVLTGWKLKQVEVRIRIPIKTQSDEKNGI